MKKKQQIEERGEENEKKTNNYGTIERRQIIEIETQPI